MNFSDLVIVIPLFELVCFVISIFFYEKYKKTKERYFVFLLAYALLTELIGLYTAYIMKVNFTLVYNVYMILSFIFYFYWYESILESKKEKKYITVLGVLFLIVSIFNMVTKDNYNYHDSTFAVGAITIIIASLFFFTQLLNDKKEIEVKYNLKFWISTGLLLFNVGMVPLMLFSKQFNSNDEVRVVVLVVLNLILYSCYSIGFILNKPAEK